MSAFPQAPPTTGPGPFGEARPSAAATLVLAGFDIVSAAWLLICVGVGLARAAIDDASRGTAAIDADFWSGWIGPLREPIQFTFVIAFVLVPFLLIASVLSIAGVQTRSEPRIFRVLVSGTVALALVIVAGITLSEFGLVFYGSIFD